MTSLCHSKRTTFVMIVSFLFFLLSMTIAVLIMCTVIMYELSNMETNVTRIGNGSQFQNSRTHTSDTPRVEIHESKNVGEEWAAFKRRFNVKYSSPEEEAKRIEIFHNNKHSIDTHNKFYEDGLKSYKLSLNHLADRTFEEIALKRFPEKRKVYLESERSSSAPRPIQFDSSGKDLPERVDWREKGIVSEIKNQRSCLACYAVVATEAIETQLAKRTGKQLLLSTQQIIDCSSSQGNLGCQGGMVDWSYKYVMQAGGLMSESDYPFTAKVGNCSLNSSSIATTISNYVEIKNGSEIALQEAVAYYGPVAVSIDASSVAWNFYSEGIYDNADCNAEVNHAVLVVGYGTDSGTDYWLVKNSYGQDYGINGYIKMSRNKNNQCSIASYANFPIIGDWQEQSGAKSSI